LLARLLARLESTTGARLSIGPKKFSGLNSLNAATNAPFTFSPSCNVSFMSGKFSMFIIHGCFNILLELMRCLGSRFNIRLTKSFIFIENCLIDLDLNEINHDKKRKSITLASFDTDFQFPSSKLILASFIRDKMSSVLSPEDNLKGFLLKI
jgi:hypothetical protein